MEEDQPKKNPSEVPKMSTPLEATAKKAKVHNRFSKKNETEKSANPHIPISTARDGETSYSKEQKKFISRMCKESKNLEKAINNEIEVVRQNKEIKRNIIDLTEKLIKTKRNRKLSEEIDELKTLYQKLKSTERKIEKERDRILTQNRKLDKLRKGILE